MSQADPQPSAELIEKRKKNRDFKVAPFMSRLEQDRVGTKDATEVNEGASTDSDVET